MRSDRRAMMRKMTMSCRLMIILVLTTALLLHWGMNEAFAQTGAVKITPSNGAYVPGNQITFSWSKTGIPDNGYWFYAYYIVIGTGPLFDGGLPLRFSPWIPGLDKFIYTKIYPWDCYSNGLFCGGHYEYEGTNITLTGLPNNGQKYYWYVIACDENIVQNSNWYPGCTWCSGEEYLYYLSCQQTEPAWSFTNGSAPAAPGAFNLTSPANGATVAGSSVAVYWSPASNATTYYLTAAYDSAFTQIVNGMNRYNVGNVTSSALNGLPNDGRHI